MAETFADRTQNAKDYLERYRQNAYEDLSEAAQEKLADFRFDEQKKAEREKGQVEAGEAEIGAPIVLRGLYSNAKGIYGNVKQLHSKISDILNKKQGTGEEGEQDDLPRPAEGGGEGGGEGGLADLGFTEADAESFFTSSAPTASAPTETGSGFTSTTGGAPVQASRPGGESLGGVDEDESFQDFQPRSLGQQTLSRGGAVSDIPPVSDLSDDAGNLIRGAGRVAARAGEEFGGDIAGKIAAGVGEAALDAIPGIGEAALAIQGLVSIGEGIAHLFHHPDKAPAVPPPTPLAVPHNITSKFATALPENGIHEDMSGASSGAF